MIGDIFKACRHGEVQLKSAGTDIYLKLQVWRQIFKDYRQKIYIYIIKVLLVYNIYLKPAGTKTYCSKSEHGDILKVCKHRDIYLKLQTWRHTI